MENKCPYQSQRHVLSLPSQDKVPMAVRVTSTRVIVSLCICVWVEINQDNPNIKWCTSNRKEIILRSICFQIN